MKKYLSTFISNGIIIAWLLLCVSYPQYSWSIKIVLYILIPMGIFACIYYLATEHEVPKAVIEKYSSVLWNVLDYFFDAINIFMFVYVGYKAIFVLYIIQIIFSAGLKIKVNQKVGRV